MLCLFTRSQLLHQLEGLVELEHSADSISLLLALSSRGIAASHSMGKSLRPLAPDSTITPLRHSAIAIQAILAAVRQLEVSFQ